METYECILTRRSVRLYSHKSISDAEVYRILKAAISAPSGKNGQPWKFKFIKDVKVIEYVAELTEEMKWLKTASCLIVVFLDKTHSYNYVKDVQSCGATIQNMLLAAHDMDIGSCWIGDLLDKADKLNDFFQIDDSLELMGAVSLGYTRGKLVNTGRKDINEFLI